MRPLAVLGVTLFIAASAYAQSGVGIELDDITDNRVSMDGFTGGLELRVKVTGSGLEKASATRVIVKDARDDRGTVLADGKADPPDFFPREYNSGTLQFNVRQPARAASTVRIKGTVELYVPSRDPNATVKVAKALSKPDAPLSAPGLKSAKLNITLLSREGLVESMKARKLDDKKIEEIRAEGKKRGVPAEEVEKMIELAKAFEGLDSEPPEGSVILSGKKADFDRIYRVEILGSDGKPIDTSGRSTSTRGDDSIMTIQPSQPVPANATLAFYLLTDKSRMSFPFDLKVTLP